jgi:hypothetical protein
LARHGHNKNPAENEEKIMNIAVMISTTRYTLQSDLPIEFMRNSDLPVCVVEMGIGMFGFSTSLEPYELHMANECMKMAKTVHIDSKTGYVFIGEDPANPETGLVEYTDDVHKPQTENFFKRWDELHMMIFEFTVFGQSGQARFAIKGFWDKTKWHSLEIIADQTIKTVTPRDSV